MAVSRSAFALPQLGEIRHTSSSRWHNAIPHVQPASQAQGKVIVSRRSPRSVVGRRLLAERYLLNGEEAYYTHYRDPWRLPW